MMVMDAMELIERTNANQIDEVRVEIFFQNPEGNPPEAEKTFVRSEQGNKFAEGKWEFPK